MRKLLVMMLAVIMLISIAACTPKADEGTATPKETKDTTEKEKEETKELIPLSVELFDRANIPATEGTIENNRWTQYVAEEMLKQGIEVTFVPVPRSGCDEKLNTLMAAGTAPDIVFTYSRLLFAQYAYDGGLQDLGPAIEEYGDNIKKYFGETGILDYGMVDGKQYAIPAQRTNPNHKMEQIRQDWLDAVGESAPTTVDELTDVLKAFRDAPAGAFGVDVVIPFGGVSSAENFESYDFSEWNLMYSFMENDKEKLITTPFPLRDGFKEFMQYMNMLWSEELLDKEFATDTIEIREAKLTNGQVGFWTDSWWVLPQDGYQSDYTTMREVIPTAKISAIEVFQNKDGSYYKSQYPPVGLYLFSPTTAPSTESVVKYINWMLTKDASITIKYGIEGEHFEYIDGAPMPIDNEYNQNTLNYVAGDLLIVWNGTPASLGQETIDALFSTQYTSEENIRLAIDSNAVAGRDAIPDVLLDVQIKAEEDNMPQLSATYDEYWVKMIIADDFETVYAEFMDKIKAQGIEEILAERQAYYDSRYK